MYSQAFFGAEKEPVFNFSAVFCSCKILCGNELHSELVCGTKEYEKNWCVQKEHKVGMDVL